MISAPIFSLHLRKEWCWSEMERNSGVGTKFKRGGGEVEIGLNPKTNLIEEHLEIESKAENNKTIEIHQ